MKTLCIQRKGQYWGCRTTFLKPVRLSLALVLTGERNTGTVVECLDGGSSRSAGAKRRPWRGEAIRVGLLEGVTLDRSTAGEARAFQQGQQGRAPESSQFSVWTAGWEGWSSLLCINEGHACMHVLDALAGEEAGRGRGEASGGMGAAAWGPRKDSLLLEGRQEGSPA